MDKKRTYSDRNNTALPSSSPKNVAHRYQARYRRAQKNKGLVRYEFQTSETTKYRFEELVKAVAEEWSEPFSERQRMAKARTQVFDELTQGVLHHFFTLEDEIGRLKEEVKALSPSFFKTSDQEQTPLPEAIRALPDDPVILKKLLSNMHQTAQQALRTASEQKRKADQFEKLYETATEYNDSLKKTLGSMGIEDSSAA